MSLSIRFNHYFKSMNLAIKFSHYFKLVMHTTLTQIGQMKVHFYNPNLVIFPKKYLNDVVVHIFFHFQVHTTII
jgi:hypothetical protein